jgi:SAM-dependent methyltransferase
VSEDQSPGFDPATPNVARIYDYYLGGKDNFAADREAARRVMEFVPEIAKMAQMSREFIRRTVQFLVAAGIRQFIDLGAGLPSQGNVHEIAQTVNPEARVVYVDNDPVVLAHAQALLADNERTTVIQGDLREPGQILSDPGLNRSIDLGQPVGILLYSVLHLLPDDDEVTRIVATLRDALRPGGYMAISHAVSDVSPETTRKVVSVYQEALKLKGPRPDNTRTTEQVTRLFGDLELVDPGIVRLPEWRPVFPARPGGPESFWVVGGVGRKI